jgi:hypothetical protein
LQFVWKNLAWRSLIRHCELREAIQPKVYGYGFDWIASLSLAMTGSAMLLFADRTSTAASGNLHDKPCNR